jgi:hypothetical protein
MKESAKCNSCGNTNEVKVSTGHNKPENKGKKYFTCANCGQFQWVEGMATPEQVAETAKGYDNEARGKTKCAVICAVIQNGGLEAVKGKSEEIERIVDYIMGGK